MKTSIKVSGVQRMVSAYHRRIGHPAIAAGLNSAARAVAANARQELDAGVESGNRILSSSLKITQQGMGQVSIGTNLEYARHLEFGTLSRPARPWLEPAFEASMPQIRASLRQALATAYAQNDRTFS